MQLSIEQAVRMLEDLSYAFGTPMPGVSVDCPDCLSDPTIVACYQQVRRTICFRSNFIPDITVAHEWGHWLQHVGLGRPCTSGCEEFANAFMHAWEVGQFDRGLRCQVCQSDRPWRFNEDSSLTCLKCGSTYDITGLIP